MRKRYIPDWRTRLAIWLAWHMPREVVYWCAVRVVLRVPFETSVADALVAWEEMQS